VASVSNRGIAAVRGQEQQECNGSQTANPQQESGVSNPTSTLRTDERGELLQTLCLVEPVWRVSYVDCHPSKHERQLL
jgi:hypothetical protein